MTKKTTAVVLAGGVGSRLKPLTSNRPKPLCAVGNHPMLDYAIWNLQRSENIKDVIVVVRYLGDHIRDYLESVNHYEDLNILVPNIDPLDTADALRKVANYVEGDQIVISMADIVTNMSIPDFITFHEDKNAFASITLKDMERPRRFGVIMVDKQSRIQLFLEKPQSEELYFTSLTFAPREPQDLHANLVNTGIYCFDQKILEILDEVQDLMDFGKHVFPYLLQEDLSIFGWVQDYYWMDCGDIQAYLWANYDLLRRWAWPFLPKGEVDYGGKWMGEVKIGEKTNIEVETAIDNGTTIGNNCYITAGSVVGENCNIGDNCVIDRSVLWENITIEDNVNLRECVICDGAIIKFGTSVERFSAIGANSIIEEKSRIEAGAKILTGQNLE